MASKKTAVRQAAPKASASAAKASVSAAKKAAAEQAKRAELARKLVAARKPAVAARKAEPAKPAEPAKRPVEAKRPAEAVKRPVEVVKPAPEQAMRKPVELHAVAKKPAVETPAAKKPAPRHGFKPNEFIVYPAHGVGQIVSIEEQEVAGYKLELFVINFVKDKMTLRVPLAKVPSVGMRKLAEPPMVRRALETLKGRARIKRTMWSRRAQEYEAKINSGDIVAIAEVVRDLYRSESQPEQSYSERQLYEAALDRLAREIAAVERVTETESIKQIEAALAKGPRRTKPAEESAEDLVTDEAA